MALSLGRLSPELAPTEMLPGVSHEWCVQGRMPPASLSSLVLGLFPQA